MKRSVPTHEIISIHAPTRGATCLPLETVQLMEKFQSTLLQEERRNKHVDYICCKYFNPRSYKRSDSKNAQYSSCISAIIIA